ncbi:MAG: DegT/DnrJ/EryC1/StrS family aminotransferase [Thermodesulfobacteriota bacterium]
MYTSNNFIPLTDLKRQYNTIKNQIQEAIEEVFNDCAFSSGKFVERFEKDFARYCGVRHCICLNSGTSALHLALLSCGVGPGDEVITVPMTFISTVWAISYVGARPVFVDIEPDTYTIDVNLIEKAITPRTRAILPVHLYGQMAELNSILEICERYNLTLIEDAAQAHGSEYNGHRAGALGQVGCFSFYPSKNLGAYGEGGAITTNDDIIADRTRALRDHAQYRKSRHEELAYNYRMDGIQGAVLSVKLKFLERWIARRRELASRYLKLIDNSSLILPHEFKRRNHVWHLFVVRHAKREKLRELLLQSAIHTGIHYPIPIHLQPAYKYLGYRIGDFPYSEQLANECLSIPMFPELTDEEQSRVIKSLNRAIEKK